MLNTLSRGLARVELFTAALLAAAITGLILLNIVTRALGNALYWTDELAIHAMVWMAFLTTSVVLKRREGIAVTLLVDALPAGARTVVALFVDAMVLFFAVLLFVLCWRWYEPAMLWATGFDIDAFQMETFNFIYSERTNTLGIPKFWSWLCLPIFSVSLGLHGLVNLTDSLKGLWPGQRRLA
ncbi:TRAP transporter small permease [Halomonas heilongjiangensis]|uniref:TRAP transporter small permease protein n=1 Tax=Halomonas heilongjiangensis TaxID=1387883 RepID=A0A2N7TPZ5_9GAMM|nr:TRAP transporter small permease [Halomonas heilongjiangensis]PMR70252.1 C4-dicarboxylate ABC transporter permease [Halomonas heilongjiangensis]PXX87271.1 C4-dicarboxylate ABC transporter permease [Halomonas heilongjiangensis]